MEAPKVLVILKVIDVAGRQLLCIPAQLGYFALPPRGIILGTAETAILLLHIRDGTCETETPVYR